MLGIAATTTGGIAIGEIIGVTAAPSEGASAGAPVNEDKNSKLRTRGLDT
jgi:hypothetical protein